jgi:hypothetical protein
MNLNFHAATLRERTLSNREAVKFFHSVRKIFFIVSKGCECDHFHELAQKVFS